MGNAGRLGTGSEADVLEPTLVWESPNAFDDPNNTGHTVHNMIAVAAGELHSLMLREDLVFHDRSEPLKPDVYSSSAPWMWGSNDSGQLLGQGFAWPMSMEAVAFDPSWPLDPLFRPDGPIPATAIAADESHTFTTDFGVLTFWGAHSNLSAPADEKPLHLTAFAAGLGGFLAYIDERGIVWELQELWNPPSFQVLSLVDLNNNEVTGTAVAVGKRHGLVLTPGGTVLAWGSNDRGQLGIGSADAMVRDASPVTDLQNVVAIAAGAAHSLALRADGTVWTWGANDQGQLGDGWSTTDRGSPGQVEYESGSPFRVRAIASHAGADHNLAIDYNGMVWAWGANGASQIGHFGLSDQWVNRPVSVDWYWDNWDEGRWSYGRVKAVAAGEYHSLALLADGHVFGWGLNEYGQLGDGTTTNRAGPHTGRPVQWISPLVENASYPLEGITAIAAGTQHSLALGRDPNVANR
jgi:alpha-tubulin suppressor-like RCC1 family protein